MSKLLLAEKPSVARNIGEALGCKLEKWIFRREWIYSYLGLWSFINLI
ncbi:hypothetical protein JTS93_21480 [Clostridium botulinum]|nr:hypothetical protein [Clostridium botulinum]